MSDHVLDPNSLRAYRYRVKLLGQELWEATEPISRLNIALLLADAATTLARLEVEEFQRLQQQENSSTQATDNS